MWPVRRVFVSEVTRLQPERWYQIQTVVRPRPTLDDEVRVLADITRAENRQWFRRMVAAGVAAGASFELMRHLMDALFG